MGLQKLCSCLKDVSNKLCSSSPLSSPLCKLLCSCTAAAASTVLITCGALGHIRNQRADVSLMDHTLFRLAHLALLGDFPAKQISNRMVCFRENAFHSFVCAHSTGIFEFFDVLATQLVTSSGDFGYGSLPLMLHAICAERLACFAQCVLGSPLSRDGGK